MANHHGHSCVICNPIGSRNRRFGTRDLHDEGVIKYNRAAFKRCDDLTDDDFALPLEEPEPEFEHEQ